MAKKRKKPQSKKLKKTNYNRPKLSYVNNEVYPRLLFKSDSLWTRIKRFFGLI